MKMTRTLLGVYASVIVCMLCAAPVLAHHSAAVAYDINKTITVKGTIAEVRWENPHTWIFVDAKDDGGSPVKWGFEGKVPNQLIRLGITPSVLKAGVEVTVTGHPARDATQKVCEVLEVTLPDGKTIKP
jgi:hypothetical protein